MRKRSLKINIQEHSLVPAHRKLSKEELDKVLKKYNVTKDNLPKILRDDPSLAKLEINVGDVVEIKRESPVAGEYFFYRVVING